MISTNRFPTSFSYYSSKNYLQKIPWNFFQWFSVEFDSKFLCFSDSSIFFSRISSEIPTGISSETSPVTFYIVWIYSENSVRDLFSLVFLCFFFFSRSSIENQNFLQGLLQKFLQFTFKFFLWSYRI